MANDYFKFKQFTIFQDQCAMKVGTDGVLLGAWTDVDFAQSILDIGSGSGLITLMLAQRNKNATVLGIEIDPKATKQAQQNASDSIFKDQIEFQNVNLKKFRSNKRFDLIVCNPPFFQNGTKSPTAERNLARHSETLNYKNLFIDSFKLLSEKGKLSIIVPTNDTEIILQLAQENQLYLERKTIIFPNEKKASKRTLFQFYKQKTTVEETSLILEKERHLYTKDALLIFKDFYLKA